LIPLDRPTTIRKLDLKAYQRVIYAQDNSDYRHVFIEDKRLKEYTDADPVFIEKDVRNICI